jgi:ParB-like chromosome segregation protein Spo0J
MVATKGAGQEAAATDLEARRNVGSGNARSSKPQPSDPQAAPRSWRDVLPVHPAADLFPLMSPDELKVLGEDIIKNGLCERVAVIDGPDGKPVLIDGRNRLDAMELVGQQFTLEAVAMRLRYQEHSHDFDPYAYVTSINLHRRHLTANQKRDLIAKLLKATPEKSDRQIAGMIKASPTTVGKVRTEVEATGDVSKLDTRTDSKGREQPARKPRPERHYCRQCGVRAVVGEVRQYNTDDPYYEGDDIWLHEACIAAFEAKEAAQRAELDDIEAEMFDDPDPDTRRLAFLLRADQARLFAVYSGPVDEDVCSIAREALAAWTLLVERLTKEMKAVSPLAPDDDLGIPPFLRRTAP